MELMRQVLNLLDPGVIDFPLPRIYTNLNGADLEKLENSSARITTGSGTFLFG